MYWITHIFNLSVSSFEAQSPLDRSASKPQGDRNPLARLMPCAPSHCRMSLGNMPVLTGGKQLLNLIRRPADSTAPRASVMPAPGSPSQAVKKSSLPLPASDRGQTPAGRSPSLHLVEDDGPAAVRH